VSVLGKWWGSGRRADDPAGGGTDAGHEGCDEPTTGPASGGFDLLHGSDDEASRRRTGPWSGRFRAVLTGRRDEGPDEAGRTVPDDGGPDAGRAPAPAADPGPPAAQPAAQAPAADDAAPTSPGPRADGFPPRYDPRAPAHHRPRGPGWGSARDVELGPPPPPDAPVNPGSPSGPIPIAGYGTRPSRPAVALADDAAPADRPGLEASIAAGPTIPSAPLPQVARQTPRPVRPSAPSGPAGQGPANRAAAAPSDASGPTAPAWSRNTPTTGRAVVPPWRRPVVPQSSPEPPTARARSVAPTTSATTDEEALTAVTRRPGAPSASNGATSGRAPDMTTSSADRPTDDHGASAQDGPAVEDAPTATTAAGRHARAGSAFAPVDPSPVPESVPEPATPPAFVDDPLTSAELPADAAAPDATSDGAAPEDTPAVEAPEVATPTTAEAGTGAPAEAPTATVAPALVQADPTPDVERPTPTPATEPVASERARLAQGRLGIDEVTPEVSGGRFPSKAVVGEVVPVTATVWREGHDAVAATLVWQRCADVDHADAQAVANAPTVGEERSSRMASLGPETDRVAASLVADTEGLWRFRVDAWSDPWATWRHAVEVKVAAGQGAGELANDLESGARLLERGAAQIEDRASAADVPDQPAGESTTPLEMPPTLTFARTLREAAASLRETDRGLPERLAKALSQPVHRTMVERPVRELLTRGADHHVVVERPRALDGAWYEFFPRSTGGWDDEGRPVHGTFATATRELERAAAMGFDVAYLPPIHPIGVVNRKGPNNTLTPGPEDVGSPWAIGSADGGHDAVHPQLGTIDDFDAFVARASELGLEVALDFALQCAPDHPWATSHQEWFTVRPDGTIAYAENPPKKYQDIYPVNFDTDPEGIYRESLRIVLYWLEHGVRIFRVDNPHTKPADFWSWLIAKVHEVDPGVVFLAEAFTRPARLFGLAKAGFSQSYTYFTWRTGRDELREFFEMHRDRIDEARPNCFVNTPDILHESLQVGGPGMFAIRATLAATLAPSWGVYAGFELFEWQPVRSGSEEYLDSEKYQLRPRDFDRALAEGRSLQPWITRLNEIRRAHPSLRQLRTLRFHDIDNDALLAYSKTDPITGDTVLCVVTLNPFGAEEGTLRLDMEALGLDPFARFGAFDEVSGQVFDWGQANYVRLEPWRDVAHVVSVQKR
jgi:alpha-1,4-glucan:maltose-1-phosphate maltosyltransferase-like protein